jgi:WD40 repeat protein/Ca2+-binding EF-hand superfamily protein
MGQVSSSPSPHGAIKSFVNLPKEAIMSIWLSYNLLGEGWSLTVDQFIAIFDDSPYLKEKYQYTDDRLRQLFESFDTDHNGLIDALEILITLGLLSAMDGIDKINFTFGAYDFDSRGKLNNDEANLLFRSAAKGLLKASPTTSEFAAVHLKDAERFADLLFEANSRDRSEGFINIDEFKQFCVSHPVVENWLSSVSSLEVGASVLPKPVVEGENRKEWISTLGQEPTKSSTRTSTSVRNHTGIQVEDIVLESEEESLFPVLPVVKPAEGVDEDGEPVPIAPVVVVRDPIQDLSWVDRVDKTKPEELPLIRYDTPEDSVDPLWVGGINVRRCISASSLGTFQDNRMHRSVRYLNYELPVSDVDEAAAAAAAEGGDGEAPPAPVSTPILYAAANHIIVSRKNEETGQWVQSLYTEHSHAISAFEVNYSKQLLVTADHALQSGGASAKQNLLVVWNLTSMKAVKHIVVPYSVKFVDVNATGSLALVVYADAVSTISIIDLQTGLPVFSRALLLDALQDQITDARFFGTSSMFAVACSKQGVRFFVHEETHLMGVENMHLYVERAAIYGALFADFAPDKTAYTVTCMTRLEAVDEMAIGTAQGQIMMWRGRCLAQVVSEVHANNGSIQALDYHRQSKQLVSGSHDGTVKVLTLVEQSTLPGSGNPSRGPKPIFTRELQMIAAYDIFRVELTGVHIASLMIHGSTESLLVATASREVLEVRNKIKPPTPEELAEAADAEAAAAEAAAAAAAEGNPPPEAAALPPAKGQLGEDMQNGAIVAAHFLPPAVSADNGALMSAVTKFNGNAFISSGRCDQTVRLWQMIGGEGDGAPVSFKVAKTIKFETDVCFVAASPSLLAVALTCACCAGKDPASHQQHGKIMLYALPDATFTTEIGDNQAIILDMKISSEGNLLVALNSKKEILVWAQTEGNWTLRGKIGLDHNISGMDLSADNAFLKVYVPDVLQVRIYDINTTGTFGKELYSSYEAEVADFLAKGPPAPVYGEDGEIIPPADDIPKPGAAIVEQIKGMSWATNNVPHNWDTIGSSLLHPPHSSGSLEISNVSTYALSMYDRSNIILASSPFTGELAGSVFFGRVPALKYQPRFNQPRQLTGVHMGPLSTLFFFDEGNAKLLTAGAIDGIIRVFKVTYDTEEPEPDMPDAPAEEGVAEEKGEEEEEGANKNKLPPVYDSGDEEDYTDRQKVRRHLARHYSPFPDPDEVQPPCTNSWAGRLGCSNLDECTKFSIKSLLAEDAASFPPVEDLEVSWVYGCTARSTRQAVRYTADHHILYPAGTMLVVFDKVKHAQHYSVPHTDEITALDYHQASGVAVTAHRGVGHIYAHVHRIESGQETKLLRTIDLGENVQAISAIAISPDAKYAIFAAQDANHRLLVYSLQDGVLLQETETGRYKNLNITFSDVALSNTSVRILVGGFRHFHLVTFHHGTTKALEVKSGGFGGDVKRCHINCAVALPMTTSVGDNGEVVATGNEFAVGLSDGTLAFLARGENKLSNLQPSMIKGGITAITVAKIKPQSGEDAPVFKLIVGGIAGVIKVLDAEVQPLQEFSLYSKPEEFGLHDLGRARGIKSVVVDKLNRKLLYATAANEVGELDLVTGKNLNETMPGKPLISGHFRDELCALATHPIRQECLTAGDDKTIRVWNLETHQQVAILELPGRVLSGTFAPNGHLIVASLKPGSAADDVNSAIQGEGYVRGQGRMAVVSYLQGQIRLVYIATEPKDAITSMVFAPDGTKVYAASLDGQIYIYDALNNFSLMATLQGHTEGIVSLDITGNGRLLISEGLGEEVIVWDTSMNTMISRASDVFDQLAEVGYAYHERQNLFGLNSLGIFPHHARKEHIRSLHQSHLGKLIATGDHTGNLRLYSNPAIVAASPCKRYRLHSAAGIQRVHFSLDDHFLLSIGRWDKMMVQWKVKIAPSGIKSDRNVQLIRKFMGYDKTNVEYAMPSTLPDDSFEASFQLKGVEFRHTGAAVQSFAPNHAFATLSAIQGVYHTSAVHVPQAVGLPASIAQNEHSLRTLVSVPGTMFCGHGEMVTMQGQDVTILEEDGQRARVINQPVVFSPANSHRSSVRGDVSALGVSPDGRYIVVGYFPSQVLHRERAAAGSVEMYHAPTGTFVAAFEQAIVGGVANFAFSYSTTTTTTTATGGGHPSYLAVLGRDVFSTVYLYTSVTGRWHEDVTFLTERPTSSLSTSLVTFMPNVGGEHGYDMVTAGQSRLLFWRIDSTTQTVTTESGFYSDDDSGESTHVVVTTALAAGTGRTAAYVGYGSVLTGDASGAVYRWEGTRRARVAIEQHPAAITAITAFADSGFLVASAYQISIYRHSADGQHLHTRAMNLVSLFSAEQLGWATAAYAHHHHHPQALRVTHLASDRQARQLLVSFAVGLTVQIAPDSGAVRRLIDGTAAPFYPVEQLLEYPNRPDWSVTVSTDGGVRIWARGVEDVVVSGIAIGNRSTTTTRRSNAFMHLIGHVQLPHPIHTAVFAAADHLLVSQFEQDNMGGSSSVVSVILSLSASSSSSSTSVTNAHVVGTVVHRLYAVGKGALTRLRWSNPDTQEYLAACSEDGCVYLYAFDRAVESTTTGGVSDASGVLPGGRGRLVPIGLLLAHANSTPVVDVDFARDGRHVRTVGTIHGGAVNRRSEVTYFVLGDKAEAVATTTTGHHTAAAALRRPAGTKLVELAALEELRTEMYGDGGTDAWQWFSAHAAVVPEVCGVHYDASTDDNNNSNNSEIINNAPATRLWQVTSVSVSPDANIVAVGYADGQVRVFRFPVYNARTSAKEHEAMITLPGHAHNAVHVLFHRTSGAGYKLVTAGKQDGLMLTWNIEA